MRIEVDLLSFKIVAQMLATEGQIKGKWKKEKFGRGRAFPQRFMKFGDNLSSGMLCPKPHNAGTMYW
ncbi:MAG: hypothetical protein DCF20_17850 [Pseudanabaena sp.]|nr:MAG: hypothetical protein DCF20_17850 [Pseudanabaena sp.]